VLLDSILALFPLDTFVLHPVSLMAVGQENNEPQIWNEYKKIIIKHEKSALTNGVEEIERFAFYERARSAYIIIQSGERELYANIILKKGVL
jgi:L-fucose mutarotase